MNFKILFYLILIFALFFTLSSAYADDNSTYCIHTFDDENQTVDVNKSPTEIQSDNKTSYVNYNDVYTVRLTSNNISLANKSVLVTLNNVCYNKTTDSSGRVSVNFKLKTGTYNVSYSFEGDEDYLSSTGTSTITVKSNLVTCIKVVDKNIIYHEGVKSILKLKLTDVNGNIISSKIISIKINGKSYSAKTDSKGIATFYLNIKKGTYLVEYSFESSGIYLKYSSSCKISVKSPVYKGNGYWVNKWDMNKINLKKLSKLKTNQIFLQHTAFNLYGAKKVINWIKKAHKYGFKVHIWISVFYKNGKFIHPSSKKGKINYRHMNKIIRQCRYYVKFKEIDGIHFDYTRFNKLAYKYKNSLKAVKYFIKKAGVTLHNLNRDLIVSSTVMPEPKNMKRHYAQDFLFMSKYLDGSIPMIYKGNYHKNSKWITKISKSFIKLSKGAQIWAGIQGYKSDHNLKKLSSKDLLKDAKAAKNGGAKSIVVFRWGRSNFLNFKKL